MGSPGCRRQVVIARQQKRRNPAVRELEQPPGELPLVGLARIPTLVGVAGQDHHVDAVGQGKLHQLVQRIQEIPQPRGQPSGRIGAAIVLHTDVQIREMQNSHRELTPTWRDGWPW